MPNISTATQNPTYPSLLKFQECINVNVIAVPAPDTDVWHSALTMKLSHFTLVNIRLFTFPNSPGAAPTHPSTTVGVATRTSTAAGGTIDPFTTQESIRQFVDKQHTYAAWRATYTLLKNMITKNVCDQYISTLKHARTKYATVSANEMLAHL